jgi:hypothetical protein
MPPPTLIDQIEIRTATERYLAARTASQQARQDATHLEQVGREQATRADAELMADALQSGSEADPGTPHSDQMEADLAAAQRRAAAAEIVVARRIGELQAVLNEFGDSWVSSLRRSLDQAAAEYQAALDGLVELDERIGVIRSVISFTEKGRFSGSSGVLPHVGQLPDLPADTAVSILRRYARPAEHGTSETAAA